MNKILDLFLSVLLFGISATSLSLVYAQDVKPSYPRVENGVTYVGPIEHPGAKAPSFTLTLSPGPRNKNVSEFRIGSKVRVTVKMTNITDHAIDHSGNYSDVGDMAYSYDVKDEDGKPVEKIPHLHPELDLPSPFWSGIMPGDSDLDQLRLDMAFRFDKPGKYTIQVFRHDPDFLDENGKPVVVKSNIITITITG